MQKPHLVRWKKVYSERIKRGRGQLGCEASFSDEQSSSLQVELTLCQ